MKKALILGSEGQDGTLLKASLLSHEYKVFGIGKSANLKQDESYFQCDLAGDDFSILVNIIREHLPDHIYYLAAYHHSSQDNLASLDSNSVSLSFKVNLSSFVTVLEIVRMFSPATRVFYASSSLIFSTSGTVVQDELTEHKPNCFYSLSKSAVMNAGKMYRENHGLFVSAGILYNHESILRSSGFLSMKIINETHKLLKGETKQIIVGDLSSETDWGYAPDYVEAFFSILQAESPGDFIVASGKAHKVQDWFDVLFTYLKLDWKKYVVVDKSLIKRKKPVLIGNNAKLMALGWRPRVSFEEMVIKLYNGKI